MKASRTLNWYFCLSSIVRVCCEMVKKYQGRFSYCHFQTIRYSFILFISQKNAQDCSEIGIWCWFWMSDESFIVLVVIFLCISTIAWNGRQDCPFPKYSYMHLIRGQPFTFMFASSNCLRVLMCICMFFECLCVSACVCVCTGVWVYRISEWIKKAMRDFWIYGENVSFLFLCIPPSTDTELFVSNKNTRNKNQGK